MKKVYSLKSMVGMDSVFAPDYQSQFPVEFNALVNWYMKTYHKESEPEKYMQRTCHAVEYANKSIMLEKLGVSWEDDLEAKNPDLFRSVFSDLAKSEIGLVVNGTTVQYTESLVKSLDGSDTIGNELYESLWLQTSDTIRQTGRM